MIYILDIRVMVDVLWYYGVVRFNEVVFVFEDWVIIYVEFDNYMSKVVLGFIVEGVKL